MAKHQKLLVGGGVLCLAIGTLAYVWFSGRDYDKVVNLVEQLAAAEELPTIERNKIKVQLMRTVDEMPRDKVREIYKKLGEQRELQEKESIAAFHAASEDEKAVILDKAIERWESGREIGGALRTDFAWGRRGRGRGNDRREGDRKKDGEEKVEPTDAEKEQMAAERALRGEYYAALKERAEVLGKEMGRGRGRGGRGRERR